MKSLRRIQILSKVAKVICIVLFVMAIVGAVGCVLGLSLFSLALPFEIKEGVTLEAYLAEKGVSVAAAYAGMGTGLFMCGVSIFLSYYNKLFFERELKEGTPFSMVIVKDMRKTALVNIITNVAACTIAAITIAIVRVSYPSIPKFDYSLVSSLWFGVCLLILSLFCEYPVENSTAPKAKEDVLPSEDYME